jgi:Opioid growth factor receptor (OGFr) conserved region
MHSQPQINAMLIPFYLGESTDLRGRTISQIWEWDVENLECTDDYIQWLFPLAEQSRFNENAPIVDDEIVRSFQTDRRLSANLLKSFEVMLDFYGWRSAKNSADRIEINRADNYAICKREWVNPFDHNYLRITRILKCLMAFGLTDAAIAFYRCLEQIYREHRDLIGGETFQYWTNAIKLIEN